MILYIFFHVSFLDNPQCNTYIFIFNGTIAYIFNPNLLLFLSKASNITLRYQESYKNLRALQKQDDRVKKKFRIFLKEVNLEFAYLFSEFHNMIIIINCFVIVIVITLFCNCAQKMQNNLQLLQKNEFVIVKTQLYYHW